MATLDDPTQLTSRLPGDALAPSPSPSPPSPPRLPVASTSAPQPATPRTLVLTSVHPSDPNKSRPFEYRYYAPSSASHSHAAASRSFLDLPESYFQPTPVELQQAYAGQVKRREDLVDRPLLTQKLRDQQHAQHARAKAARWPHTRIRIRFPDRSQLEGVFPSTDKLVHLYEFVRIALRPDVRHCPFVLYQSPPRTEYRRGAPAHKGKSLIDLQLTPSSALYIKFEPPSTGDGPALDVDALNDPAAAPPLVPELLAAVAELPAPPSFDPREPDARDGESDEQRKKREKEDKLKRLLGGGGGGAAKMLGMGGAKGGVTPSWMKLGKDAHKK
ncbi:hypothetical protein JCM3770_003488 [Rhodotorula araucariae]